jgi:hypothetical protein
MSGRPHLNQMNVMLCGQLARLASYKKASVSLFIFYNDSSPFVG